MNKLLIISFYLFLFLLIPLINPLNSVKAMSFEACCGDGLPAGTVGCRAVEGSWRGVCATNVDCYKPPPYCNTSGCSKACGGGIQTQTCSNTCGGTSTTTMSCNTQPCPTNTPIPTATPIIMCTPPPCNNNEIYYCRGTCPGGCGTICVTGTPTITLTPCTPLPDNCINDYPNCIANMGLPAGGWCPSPTPSCVELPSCIYDDPPCQIAPFPPGVIACPTVSPTPISCNYTVNPLIRCPYNYQCITTSHLLGASGICVKVTPTPNSTCPTKTKGDANCDGSIDGLDYSLWLNSQCHPSGDQQCSYLKADFNNDGNVDDSDYIIWENNRK